MSDKTLSLNSNIDDNWLGRLTRFPPFAMIIRLYTIFVICYDISYFLGYSIYSILENCLHLVSPPASKSVKDEITLVIGSAKGIGKEIALQMSKLGANIICLDKDATLNEKTVEEIRAQNGMAYSYTCNVIDEKQVKDTIKLIEEEIGTISMMFHCCNILNITDLFRLTNTSEIKNDETSIKTKIDVNIEKYYWILEQILPIMKHENNGHIVLLNSIAGHSVIKNQMSISASQYAVQGLFESIIEDLRIGKYNDSIHVTLCYVYPYLVNSMTESTDLSDTKNRQNNNSTNITAYFRLIKPEDAASKIITAVLRNSVEISLPWYLIYITHLIKLLPRKASFMLKDILDSGLDIG